MTTEASIQQMIRIEAARRGTPLLRNNSGASIDNTGRLIRFGLGNDSAKLNSHFKSADLIGIYPVTIGPEHIGIRLGLFFAVEVKKPGAKPDDRTEAQANFGKWVTDHGGLFRFATSIEDVWG